MKNEKIAVKINTERDRELVIPFLQSLGGGNVHHVTNDNIDIGEIWYISTDKNKIVINKYVDLKSEGYTILEGVPTDFELPKTTESKTREQQLEEENKALRDTLEMAKQYFSDGTTDDLIILCEWIDKQLINK